MKIMIPILMITMFSGFYSASLSKDLARKIKHIIADEMEKSGKFQNNALIETG